METTHEDAIRRLLAASAALRRIASDPGEVDSEERRTTSNVARLVETWCVDHAKQSALALLAELDASDREDDGAVLAWLRRQLG